MKVKIGFGPVALTFDVDFVQDDGGPDAVASMVQQATNAANRADQAASRAEQAVMKLETK